MSINMQKNQTVNLTKESGGNLSVVRLGLGWDMKRNAVAPKKGFLSKLVSSSRDDIDLDASAIMVSNGRVIDTIYFGHLVSNDKSIQHTGDNLTGEGEGDDESIIVDLSRVSPQVNAIIFTVNSFSGETFDQVENAFVRVVDSNRGDRELVRYTLTNAGPHTAQVMGALLRDGNGWSFQALGEPGQGRTVNQVADLALRCLHNAS